MLLPAAEPVAQVAGTLSEVGLGVEPGPGESGGGPAHRMSLLKVIFSLLLVTDVARLSGGPASATWGRVPAPGAQRQGKGKFMRALGDNSLHCRSPQGPPAPGRRGGSLPSPAAGRLRDCRGVRLGLFSAPLGRIAHRRFPGCDV